MDTVNHDNSPLVLGRGQYESGTISVPANTVIRAGTVLKRAADGSFAAAASGDTVVAVNPADITNGAASAQSQGFRALVGGEVNAGLLRYQGSDTPLTAAQLDALRDYGIVPAKVKSLGGYDN
jgi:hypothetical protein